MNPAYVLVLFLLSGDGGIYALKERGGTQFALGYANHGACLVAADAIKTGLDDRIFAECFKIVEGKGPLE